MQRVLLRILAPICGLVVVFAAQAGRPPQVVTTIAPIANLVAGVTAGITTPKLLVPAGTSPHHFQLKPSQAAEIMQADIIFWLGPEFELFMPKMLQNVSQETLVINLFSAPGLVRHANREADSHHHGHEHGHEHGHLDPHIWLSPDNADRLVTVIAQKMSAFDKENAARYQENAKTIAAQLDVVKQQIGNRLNLLHNKPFLVLHDAYQYFEKTFKLDSKGTLLNANAQALSAKKLQDTIKQVETLKIRCVFQEQQLQSNILKSIQESYDLKLGRLDPLGTAEPPRVENYYRLLTDLATQFSKCLAS